MKFQEVCRFEFLYGLQRSMSGVESMLQEPDESTVRLGGLRAMRQLAERAYFLLCLGLGRLLRAGRYSRAQIVTQGGELQVRKYRFFYAPLLVWMGGPLVRILNTGVRVLPQRDWEEVRKGLHR